MKNERIIDHKKIESKWQHLWEKVKLNEFDVSQAQNPFYNLMMFPYPSAEGLHVGNMYAFTGSDIYGRFKRLQGYDVFEPIGLDGFGIHSENYALKVGRHPMDHAAHTEVRFYNQLHKIGSMYDWSRTVETYKSDYYQWTQWLFVQMFKHGLAYRKKALVNWCPGCKTVLADEQVIDGKCERCGNIVEKRPLEQWFFRITAYAEKLLSHIQALHWSEKVKIAQMNWIGQKKGIEITYKIIDENDRRVGDLTCFTTRPDTNYGATFIAISPEHDFVNHLMSLLNSEEKDKIRQFLNRIKKESENASVSPMDSKEGIFTGMYAINELTSKKIPVFIADYVLITFGTGAVVGVPGHDKRDFLFAKQHGLPIIRVVVARDGKDGEIDSIDAVQEDEGIMVHSDFLNGLDVYEATKKIMDYMEQKGYGKRKNAYHLRDWLISRQRYWGPPIPMIYCQRCADAGDSWFTSKEAQTKYSDSLVRDTIRNETESIGWYPVAEDQLPVRLPRIDDYKPTGDGQSPLSKHTEFYETLCPGCGGKAVRETDVSDTFLDSSWYFLRYPSVSIKSDLSKKIVRIPWDKDITKKWLPVHMYTGGAEHSVLHLLYSRFVTMALNDMGHINFDEPFQHFFAHGLVIKDGAKMSKSKGNVINPDEYIETYGCDALRLYLMFMGPFSDGGDFRDASMEGMSRWLKRVWNLVTMSIDQNTSDTHPLIEKSLQKLIIKVTEDIEKRRYNTAIAAMMEFTNTVAETNSNLTPKQVSQFLLLLAPFAVHTTEELWQISQGKTESAFTKNDSIHVQKWPVVESKILDEEVTIVLQVNSKVRDVIQVPVSEGNDKQKLEHLARSNEKILHFTEGKIIKKVVVIPAKLVNFVL